MTARILGLLLSAMVLLIAPATATASAAPANFTFTQFKDNGPVTFGGTILYTITVRNTGLTPDNAVVTAAVPAGTTFGKTCVGAANTNCDTTAPPGGTISRDLGSVAAGATKNFYVYLETDSVGEVTFTAAVRGTGTDPTTQSKTTTIRPRSNLLSVSITDTPDPATTGQQVTYTVKVANADTVRAKGVTLTFTPPGGSATTVDLGTLGPGASAPDQVFTATFTGVGLYTATAAATAATTTGTATDSETTKVAGPPTDLAVDIADTPDPALEGGTITYTITATNQGANAAEMVTATAGLPSGMVLEAATPATCTSSGTPTMVSCALGTLAAGASATVTLKANTAVIGTHTVSASVDSAAAETDPADNAAAATTEVRRRIADLSVAISDPGAVIAGDAFELGFVVSNPDIAPADNVRLDITVPEGVRLLAVTSSRAVCGTIGNVLSCPMQRINGGASPGVRLRLRAEAPTTLPWSATVFSTTADPVKANNTATSTVTVVPKPVPTPDPGTTPTATPTPTPTPDPPSLALRATLAGKSIKLSKGIPVALDLNGPASVRLDLKARRRTIASLTRGVSADRTLVLRLPKAARRAITRMRPGTKLTLTVTATGPEDSATRRLRLKVARSGRLKPA